MIFKHFLSFIKNTPANLQEWSLKTKTGVARFFILAFLLGVAFYAIGQVFYFHANDAFISFRYATNAVKGFGIVFNPAPFIPVDGFTSFLWVVLLKYCWSFFGFLPPFSADILTFVFSMASVLLCFAFIKRMRFPDTLQNKSLWIFLIVCLVLITNRTFLAFMSSGTEGSFFNFLALWWTFEATSKTRTPLWLSTAAALLALTRLEGIVFVPATVLLLVVFLFQKRGFFNILLAFLPLVSLKFYFAWRVAFYGDIKPNLYLMLFEDMFPDFGWDYFLSFVVEYGLYVWIPFFIVWGVFKFLTKSLATLAVPIILFLTFSAYVGYYVCYIGADILEFRPFGILIPLTVLAGIRMITENISRQFRFLSGAFILYFICALPIPWTHYFLTSDLKTRSETSFLYQPVSEKIGFLGYLVSFWDQAQNNLISQGAGLRHQEHKILTNELLASFPVREIGSRIELKHRRLYAFNFVGVPAWVLPETFIIDVSGQNDWIIARSYLKTSDKRVLGHDRTIASGYIPCFNGGVNLNITPFDGTPDISFIRSAYLGDNEIRGCEGFWRSQARTRQEKLVPL